MNAKQLADEIASLANDLVGDIEKQLGTGNQAAGRRARVSSSKIAKLCKEFRKASLAA